MIRRFRLWTAAAFVVLFSGPAFGLGPGELQLQSALNQSFEAEIPLTNVRGLTPEEILPNLASQEDFNRVGVERGYQLLDLRFRVVAKDDGLWVRVTSSRPIIEPYLNFIVEVLWPSGRILREYTVLLDPPTFGEQGIAPIQLSQGQGADAARQAPAARTGPRAAPRASQRTDNTSPGTSGQPGRDTVRTNANDAGPMQEGEVYGDEYGVTGPGDTLWAIALKVKPGPQVSVQQVMLALQRANPDAFINDNINLLKAGHVLRIPDADELRDMSFNSAVRQVRDQNAEFDSYRAGSGFAQMDATPRSQRQSSDRDNADDGELRLLAGSSTRRSDSGAGGDAGELQDELDVAKEDLDRATRANTELNLKLDDLRAQNETLNEIVKQKEDRLALLQAQVAKLQQVVQSGGVADAAAAAPAPASGGSLLSNPLVLGGGALLLVVLAAGGLLVARRRREAADDDEPLEEPVVVASQDVGVIEEDDDVELALEEEEQEDEDVSPQTSDIISEAEIYIAYGRFPQAITFLQNAIESEPERTDVQLKLMEVYTQTEDATAFNLLFEGFSDIASEAEIQEARTLQAQIPGAAESAEAAMDATVISAEPVAELGGDDDGDLDLELDDDGAIELDLEEDANNKLDLARAYIDMGDSDGARNVLQEIVQDGSESEVKEANELLGKID